MHALLCDGRMRTPGSPAPHDVQLGKLTLQHGRRFRESLCVSATLGLELLRLRLRLQYRLLLQILRSIGRIDDDADGRAVHFDGATGYREQLLLLSLPDQDAPRHHDRDNRNVVRQNSDLAVGCGERDRIDVAGEDRAVGSGDGKCEHGNVCRIQCAGGVAGSW